MLPWAGALVVSWVVTSLAAPLLRGLAIKRDIVDEPDEARKAHGRAVPMLGGAAILVGVIAGLAAAVVWASLMAEVTGDTATIPAFPWTVVLGCAVITITGLVDDVWGVIPRIKVGGQLIAAAALAYQSNLGVALVSYVNTSLGIAPPSAVVYALGAVVLGLFIVGGCNAINLLDGLDGLATSVSAIAAAGLLIVAAISSRGVLFGEASMSPEMAAALLAPVLLSLTTLGSTLGFLPWNRSPARMFLGDSGSLLLGYLLVAAVLHLVKVGADGLTPVMAGLVVVALPCADTALAIVRRVAARRWITVPDRLHLHHLLVARGISERAAVSAICVLAIIAAILGAIVAASPRGRAVVIFAGVYGVITLVAIVMGARQARVLRAETGETASDSARVNE